MTTDTQTVDPDAEEMAIAERFLLEIFSAAGENGLSEAETDAAWDVFHGQRVTAAMIEMWDDGLLRVSYLPDQNDIGYQLTDFGVSVRESLDLGA